MMDLPIEVLYILRVLLDNGYEAFVVGGCVRDMLLERTPHDWDITTNATPDIVIECFKEHQVIKTGILHGTVTIILNKKQFEITTYRCDGKYSDNRHPDDIRFVKSLYEDLKRRDFTINALAYNPLLEEGEHLIDYFNGVKDINHRLIRCVGNPNDRFKEDGLRILRAVRFCSTLHLGVCPSFDIEPKTSRAINDNINLLDNISKERIQSELNKILYGNNREYALSYYSNIIFKIIPEMKATSGFDQNHPAHEHDIYNHIIKTLSHIPFDADLSIALAAFLHDIGKPQTYSVGADGFGHFSGHWDVGSKMSYEILTNLKYSNDIKDSVRELILWHDYRIMHPIELKHLLNKIGTEQFERLLVLKNADALDHTTWREKRTELFSIQDMYNKIKKGNECYSLKQLAVNGDDLIKVGFMGASIGEMLNILLNVSIRDNGENDKENLLKIAENIYKKI